MPITFPPSASISLTICPFASPPIAGLQGDHLTYGRDYLRRSFFPPTPGHLRGPLTVLLLLQILHVRSRAHPLSPRLERRVLFGPTCLSLSITRHSVLVSPRFLPAPGGWEGVRLRALFVSLDFNHRLFRQISTMIWIGKFRQTTWRQAPQAQ